jgi:hypothetical protein
VDSRTTVTIPFDFRVVFIRSLNSAEFPIRFSEIAQALNAISARQLLTNVGRLTEWRSLGTVRVGRRSSM